MRLFISIFALIFTLLPIAARAELSVAITLEKNGADQWEAVYEFSKPIPGFIFGANKIGHHLEHWTSITPGAELLNADGLDAVRFEGKQTQARFTIKTDSPVFTRTIFPSRSFSDGSVLFFSHEFFVLPVKKFKKLKRLKGSIDRWRGRIPEHTLTVKSNLPLLSNGQVFEKEIQFTFDNFSYENVIVGQNGYSGDGSYQAVIDKDLNENFKTKFTQDMNTLLERHSKSWGTNLPAPPTIIVRTRNLDKQIFSARGVEMDGKLVVMEISGNAFMEYNPDAREMFLKVLSHEMAHLFQGQNRSYTSIRSAWIAEGSANLMSYDTLLSDDLISSAAAMNHFGDSYESCAAALDGQLDHFRGLNRSRLYDCGDMLALITHKIAPGHDLYDVWNALIESESSERFKNKDFYKILKSYGANPGHIAALQNLIENNIESSDFINPGAKSSDALKDLMILVGLSPKINEYGRLTQMTWR